MIKHIVRKIGVFIPTKRPVGGKNMECFHHIVSADPHVRLSGFNKKVEDKKKSGKLSLEDFLKEQEEASVLHFIRDILFDFYEKYDDKDNFIEYFVEVAKHEKRKRRKK